MLILGIGGLVHDASAVLLRDGELLAAVEAEKIIRQQHPGGLPHQAIESCLAIAKVKPEQIDRISMARPLGAGEDSAFNLQLKSLFPNSRIVIVDHHNAHAAAAFYPSPFDEATVLTLDHAGDMRCGALWHARGSRIDPVEELYSPESPAAVYCRISELLGFRAGAEEHKVQWISVGGEPRFREKFLAILRTGHGRLPQLDHSYFDTSRAARGGFSSKFFEETGIAANGVLPEVDRADIAASVQSAVETIVLDMAGEGGNLCLGGGLALNALLVAALEASGRYKQVWAQPVAGNAGCPSN